MDEPNLDLLGRRAAALSTWLDSELGKRLSPEALALCRVSKCANESGEALNALERALGMNPRKGRCGTMDEVRDELLDVALTALGAYEHLSGAHGASAHALLAHTESRMRRVGLLPEPDLKIEVPADAELDTWVDALRSSG